jgi:hypothetical protein
MRSLSKIVSSLSSLVLLAERLLNPQSPGCRVGLASATIPTQTARRTVPVHPHFIEFASFRRLLSATPGSLYTTKECAVG